MKDILFFHIFQFINAEKYTKIVDTLNYKTRRLVTDYLILLDFLSRYVTGNETFQIFRFYSIMDKILWTSLLPLLTRPRDYLRELNDDY